MLMEFSMCLLKSMGKKNKITITNDKGRLSKDDIERMVHEAEQYKNEDEAQRDRIAAKNALESYCYNMKQSLEDEKASMTTWVFVHFKMCFALDEGCRRRKEQEQGLDSNQMAEKEEFEHHQKDLESLCNPIMAKFYASAGSTGGGSCAGPTVEEVD